ncbi:hypothetical protein D9M71_474550 [compost metagenome]
MHSRSSWAASTSMRFFGSTRRMNCTRASTDSEKKVQNSQSLAFSRSRRTCSIFSRVSVE